VAIIGAGVAGLAAAFELSRRGIEAEVFEAAARLGGRCVTGWHGPARFDTGAQFFRTGTPDARTLVLDRLPAGDLVDVRKDVVPFAADGVIGAGDPAQNAEPKWVYRQGIGELPRLLARASGAHVHLGCAVQSLRREADGWRLVTPTGNAGPFAAVLVTATPAAAFRLLEGSHAPGVVDLSKALSTARYRSIASVVLRPGTPVAAPEGVYAMVNSDRAHAVSWLAFEHEKPGYAPPGECVLVAQMASGWSAPRMGADDRALAFEAAEEVAALLGEAVRPRWWHVERWPEALPDTLIAAETVTTAEDAGLFFAGDAATGGRVHLALESGLSAARRMARALDGVPAR